MGTSQRSSHEEHWLREIPGRICVFSLGASLLLPLTAAAASPSLAQSAAVTVGSCSPGYGATVLTDRKWWAKGEENPNLARLNGAFPGAASTVTWNGRGKERVIGDSGVFGSKSAQPVLSPGCAVGVKWPVRHSMSQVSLSFAADPPSPSDLVLEADDGRRWVPITTGLVTKSLHEKRRIEWTFEPVVTRGVRVRMTGATGEVKVTEIAVLRFMPPSKDVWPERFVNKNGIQQELLAEGREPSFESAALKSHNMRTARAFVGLKDHPCETGVGWDGTLYGRERIQFQIRPEGHAMTEYPDTVTRTLIDGWRPGVIIEGRVQDLRVRETVFALPAGPESRPITFIRFSVKNLSTHRRSEWVEAALSGEGNGSPQVANGLLTRGNDAVLLSQSPVEPGELPGSMRVGFTLDPNQEGHFDFIHPQETNAPASLAEECRTLPFERSLAQFRRYWDHVMATPTVVEVPEPRVNQMIKAVLAQCFICGDGNVMPYGVAPSVYEASLFGIEESYPMLGLALFGYGEDAERYMDGTYLTREFLKKAEEYKVQEPEARHQQYRNGLEPHYAISLYRLTRDDGWIRRHVPLLKDCADWTLAQRRRTMELKNGRKPLHWGLLPKWAYGGDILDVLCYPIFPNLCCWRGLVDTAWVLDELGDTNAANVYRTGAREYRADIDQAVEGSYRPNDAPPFLPLKVSGTKPDEQLDFYQLFAGCLLDVEPFETGNRHAHWITDYLEESNRMFCHLPRFRHMGPGALDALYGKGYWLSLMHDDSVRDFLLAFYSYLAYNMEHETFVSRESNALYPSDLHQRSSFPAAESTDPLVCASAVSLHLARHMLVTEERGAPGDYSGNLLLLPAIPRDWLQDGKAIRMRDVPTHFGPMCLEVRSRAGKQIIAARFTPPTRNLCKSIKLRFRHPDSSPIQSVRLNGKTWSEFDPVREWVILPGNIGPCRVAVHY